MDKCPKLDNFSLWSSLCGDIKQYITYLIDLGTLIELERCSKESRKLVKPVINLYKEYLALLTFLTNERYFTPGKISLYFTYQEREAVFVQDYRGHFTFKYTNEKNAYQPVKRLQGENLITYLHLQDYLFYTDKNALVSKQLELDKLKDKTMYHAVLIALLNYNGCLSFSQFDYPRLRVNAFSDLESVHNINEFNQWKIKWKLTDLNEFLSHLKKLFQMKRRSKYEEYLTSKIDYTGLVLEKEQEDIFRYGTNSFKKVVQTLMIIKYPNLRVELSFERGHYK